MPPLFPKRNCPTGAARSRPLLSLSMLVVALLLTGPIPQSVVAFVPSFQRVCPRTLCATSSSEDTNDNADLLEKARKLREEASLLEDDLRANAPTSSAADVPAAVVNTKLEESKWILTYRFSSQPSPKDSEDDEIAAKEFYSGKINLLLKEDGYSEQITIQDASSKNKDDIQIEKIWGWDRETSNEDNLDYLLFSMDVKFPASDPDLANQAERYYFQARIETETSGGIALKEGTITVKKDVTEKTGGMWGFFNVAGILTEFRYTGDFVAKASQ